MSSLQFKANIEFDTSGDLRIEKRRNEYYVVGRGWLIHVDSEEEGFEVISDLISSKSRHSER